MLEIIRQQIKQMKLFLMTVGHECPMHCSQDCLPSEGWGNVGAKVGMKRVLVALAVGNGLAQGTESLPCDNPNCRSRTWPFAVCRRTSRRTKG